MPIKATITELDNQLSAITVTNRTLERMFKTTDARVTELEKNGRYQAEQVQKILKIAMETVINPAKQSIEETKNTNLRKLEVDSQAIDRLVLEQQDMKTRITALSLEVRAMEQAIP